jgi:hypothetical protein
VFAYCEGVQLELLELPELPELLEELLEELAFPPDLR